MMLVHVTIALCIEDGADLEAVIGELDYNFDHPAIIDQEFINFEEIGGTP